MYDHNHQDLKVLPAAPRYLRRNASRAMGGYVVRGLVELITNARDSAFRMYERDELSTTEVESRTIHIDYFGRHDDRPRFVVRDEFEGMSAEDMDKRLLQYGTPSSEFEAGGAVRGLNARGAKDVASLGVLEYKSIHDGELASCLIVGGQYRPPTSRSVGPEDRAKLRIGEANGTVVTLVPDSEITFPKFDRLARDLNRHIEIRYQPEQMPSVPIMMREMEKKSSIRREVPISGLSPEGTVIDEREIELSEYTEYGPAGKLRLYYSDEPLEKGGRSVTRLWKSEAGVLIADGHTAHDITFFDADRRDDAAARHLFGELLLPQIEGLILEFEQLEAKKEKGDEVSTPERNPSQVTDPDRLGLNREHPFVQAVYTVVAPIIEERISDIQETITPAAEDRIQSELRESLQNLGRKLAEQLEVSEGGKGNGEDDHPIGLSFVPGGMRLEPGEHRSGNIYLCMPEEKIIEEVGCTLTVEGKGVEVEENELMLVVHPETPGMLRGEFHVRGVKADSVTTLRASAAGFSASLRVSVREPLDQQIDLDQDLQLSQSVYTSTPGRKKKIVAFSDPAISGERVAFEVTDENLELEKTSAELVWDEERQVGVAESYVYCESEMQAKVKVSLRDLSDKATVIYESTHSEPEIEIQFQDKENFGPGRRFQWDLETPNRLLIAALHPTLERVLGPDVDPETGEQWPGQTSPQTAAILAELIAEAYASRRLDRELAAGGLGVGPENLVDPIDYENFRYQCYEECYLICHEHLTPPYA